MASETPPPSAPTMTTMTNGSAKVEALPPDKSLAKEHLVLPSRPGPSPQPSYVGGSAEANPPPAPPPPEDDGSGYVAPKFEGKEQQMDL